MSRRRVRTSDGFAAGDCIERAFPGREPTRGTIVRVYIPKDEIVVAWDRGGFPQVLPPNQRGHVTRIEGGS